MTYDEILPYIKENNRAVITTLRRSGAVQTSIVTCGPVGGSVAFSTTANRAKLNNLLRDTCCSMLVARGDWSRYVVIEETADIRWSDRTHPDDFRLTLREVYKTASGKDHPNWEQYDAAMVEQGRAAILVMPENIYRSGAS